MDYHLLFSPFLTISHSEPDVNKIGKVLKYTPIKINNYTTDLLYRERGGQGALRQRPDNEMIICVEMEKQ